MGQGDHADWSQALCYMTSNGSIAIMWRANVAKVNSGIKIYFLKPVYKRFSQFIAWWSCFDYKELYVPSCTPGTVRKLVFSNVCPILTCYMWWLTLKRGTLQMISILILSFYLLQHFLSFKMTPYLLKLIKLIKFYNRKSAGNSFYLFIFLPPIFTSFLERVLS